MSDVSSFCMSSHVFLTLKEAQTVMAYEETVDVVVALRVRREIPGLTFVFTDLNPFYCLYFSSLLMH